VALLKISNRKRAGGVAQVVEDLHSTCETLSSNPSTTKQKYFYIYFEQIHVTGNFRMTGIYTIYINI
jgi:hypothetical protein